MNLLYLYLIGYMIAYGISMSPNNSVARKHTLSTRILGSFAVALLSWILVGTILARIDDKLYDN